MQPLFTVPPKTDGTQVLTGLSVCLETISRCGVVPRDSRGRPTISKNAVPEVVEYAGGTSYDIAVGTGKTFGLRSFLIASVAADNDEYRRQFVVSRIEDLGIPFHPLAVRRGTSWGNIVIEGNEDPVIYSYKPGYLRTPVTEVMEITRTQNPQVIVATGIMPEEVELIEAISIACPNRPLFLNPRGELIEEPVFFERALHLNPILFLNHQELGKFLGEDIPENGVTHNHVRRLHELGAQYIIVTCNETGAVMSIRDHSELLMQPARRFGNPRDKTGAGDSFLSGCVAAVFSGKSPEEMLHWGATTAGLKVLREGGSNVPTAEEFKNAL